ncbi:MAG TPA: magnesium transporter, partial [Planctomycetaceae bacterium]
MHDVAELAAMIHLHRDEDHDRIRSVIGDLRAPDAADVLNAVPSLAEVAEVLELLPLEKAIDICSQPSLGRRSKLLEQVPPELGARLLDGLASDERTAIFRHMSAHGSRRLMPLLSNESRDEVERQLQYREGTAGDLMSTEFVKLAPTFTVAEALTHIHEVARDRETIYACYVVDTDTGYLLGALSLRDLVMADGTRPVSEVMRPHPVTVSVGEPQKEVERKISKYNLLAAPVLESDGRIVGFVTVDDVIDVLIEEQTNAMLRMGGVEAGALDDPYIQTPWQTLVRKRASWLVLLFLGEMLTATAMGHFEEQIAKAVVLALFVPLIISSGGNSGSQATSLLIRALALSEVGLCDWFKVFRRELISGLSLGLVLGSIGVVRICLWEWLGWQNYGEHWFL